MLQAAEGVKRARLLRLRSRIASAHRDGLEGMAAAPPAAAAAAGVERGQQGVAVAARSVGSNDGGGDTAADDSDGDEGVSNDQAVGGATGVYDCCIVHMDVTAASAARWMLAFTAQQCFHPVGVTASLCHLHSRLCA